MSVPNTLLVDGHDLRAMTGIRVYGDMQLYAPGTRRGSDDVIPGRAGQIGAPGLPLDAYAFTVPIFVSGATRGAMVSTLHTLASQLNGVNQDGLVVLTRRLANADDSGYDEYTANGRFVSGLSLQVLNPITGQTELQFINLDGLWKRTSDGLHMIP